MDQEGREELELLKATIIISSVGELYLPLVLLQDPLPNILLKEPSAYLTSAVNYTFHAVTVPHV
jgi:hypothetical protein